MHLIRYTLKYKIRGLKKNDKDSIFIKKCCKIDAEIFYNKQPIMTNLRRTLFISDLHLAENYPAITEEFLQLLAHCPSSTDALYILGDLFDTWIGDDEDSLFHQRIISALKSATQKGLAIYFIHGNRDFLIGEKFLTQTGVKCLAEEERIILYDTPILLMHGDTLCTRDTVYLVWRKFARNALLQKIFLWFPLRFRRLFTNKLRLKSHAHMQSMTPEIMDVTQAAVEQKLQKHAVYTLIHGHTHRPAQHEFDIHGMKATRIVLAAWHDYGSVLTWDETGRKKVMRIHFITQTADS